MVRIKKSYYIVTPSQLLQDVRLTSTARVVYGVVENLTHKTGECFASNEYILAIMGECFTDRTLQRALALLEQCGYIKRTIMTEIGKQNERRIIISNDWKQPEITRGGGDKNDTTVMTKKSDSIIYDEKQSIKKYSLITRVRVNEFFEKLWDAYPKTRRGSKQQAYDAFVHVICNEHVTPEQILEKLPEYINSAEVADLGMVQYLYRWLDNRGYESEYTPAKPKDAPEQPREIAMPPIGQDGIARWQANHFAKRMQNRTWETVFERMVDAWRTGGGVVYEILNNIRTVGGFDDRKAHQIYYLGLHGDIAAIEQSFAVEWWKRDAYKKIRTGTASLDECRALWADIVRDLSLPDSYLAFDPTAVLADAKKFWDTMGW